MIGGNVLKYLVHVGRQKTGSSSIQNVLSRSATKLDRAGYVYLETSPGVVNHNGLFAPLRVMAARRQRDTSQASAAIAEVRSTLEARACDSRTNIVSAEVLHNFRPSMVRALFEGHDYEIAVYVRNEIEQLASSYAQAVRNTDIIENLHSYVGARHAQFNEVFLNAWSVVHERRFKPAVYHPRWLHGGDVVEDFFDRYLRLENLGSGARNYSQSISETIVAFKLWLNRNPSLKDRFSKQKDLFAALLELSRGYPGRFSMPAEIASGLVQELTESQARWGFRYFGQAQIFDYAATPTQDQPLTLQEPDCWQLVQELSAILSKRALSADVDSGRKLR